MTMDNAFGPTVGGNVQSAAAGSFMDPVFRDQMDARRSMWRRTPDAEYPDGYLGTITSRRKDRLIEAIGKQMNRKVYDRGVHKGERIDQSDYFWPGDQDPMRGLVAQAEGRRQAPIQTVPERMIVNDGKALPYDNAAMVVLDPKRQHQLTRLSPRYRS
jgi:hypothetical protein